MFLKRIHENIAWKWIYSAHIQAMFLESNDAKDDLDCPQSFCL